MNLQQASVCSANLNMLLGLFRGLVTYKRTMDKIEMFLKYPSLFVDTNLTARQFGSPQYRGNGPRIDGTASSRVDGLLFVSGLPRRLTSDSHYSSGSVCGMESLPEVTVSKEGRYDVKYKTQKIIYQNNNYFLFLEGQHGRFCEDWSCQLQLLLKEIPFEYISEPISLVNIRNDSHTNWKAQIKTSLIMTDILKNKLSFFTNKPLKKNEIFSLSKKLDFLSLKYILASIISKNFENLLVS